MNTMEKTLEYHELLMTYPDTGKYSSDSLPAGFHYEFFNSGDETEWADIHIKSGEFMSMEEALDIFHAFYDSFLCELPKRLFFVATDTGEKVGTATISLLKEKEFGYDAVVDWFAIKKAYQGYHLSKPMINRFIKLANELGHKQLLLHTQTHTWLAAKLYLDMGFEPFHMEDDRKGWQILKTIINYDTMSASGKDAKKHDSHALCDWRAANVNHESKIQDKLKSVEAIPENELYFPIAIKTKETLDKLFGADYEYSIWYKNGRNDVDVNYNNQLYQYKYYDDEKGFRLVPLKK